jgi:16S rRNA (uracil1498-N3)-methyltransferase
VARLSAAAALAIILDPDAAAGLRSLPLPARGDIVVVIGPEGGISPAEAARLTSAGAVSARLGPSVLRASSAGAVAAALLLSAGDRWS